MVGGFCRVLDLGLEGGNRDLDRMFLICGGVLRLIFFGLFFSGIGRNVILFRSRLAFCVCVFFCEVRRGYRVGVFMGGGARFVWRLVFSF